MRLLPGSSRKQAFHYLQQVPQIHALATNPSQEDHHFLAQEIIQQLILHDPHNYEAICKPIPQIDKKVWLIEQLRQMLQELNQLCVLLDHVCTKETCPKMIATRDEFLCAAHPTPSECCAIDYIVHTMNGFTALLNSNEYFPSRINIQGQAINFAQPITRRLYRVFAHAFYRHPDIFWEFELKTYLCSRFKYFVTTTKLMPVNQFLIDTNELQKGIAERRKQASSVASASI